MNGLESVIETLESVNLDCEMWIDGSFVTQKTNPNDADIVVRVSAPYVDSASQEIRDAVTWIGSDLKSEYMCDSYLLPVYPTDHPLYANGRNLDAYWKGQLGFSRANDPKGIAVIKLGRGVQ